MGDASMTCETCRFWHPDGSEWFGNRLRDIRQEWAKPCRRYPEHKPRWWDDWCGEYQERTDG